MPGKAPNRNQLLNQLIEEQAREKSQRYVYPQIIKARGGALFDLLTESQMSSIVLGRLMGPKKAAGVLGISVSGIEKHILRAEQKLSGEQRIKLKNGLKIIASMT